MKRILYLAALASAACDPPRCPEGERKVGKTCYEIPAANFDAGPLARGDAASEGDVAESAVDGDTAQRRDAAARDLDVETFEAGVDASAEASEDAGRGDGGSPVKDGDAGSPSEDASTDDASIRDAATCQPSPETCNGKDDDCDGAIDESPPTWYPDCDLDGAPSIENGIIACSKPTPADCTSWTDKRPAVSDCNDRDRRYSPNVPAFMSNNAPNALEEQSYIGDMDCDGVVEKPALWDFYTNDDGWQPGPSKYATGQLPLCPQGASACNVTLATECYENHDDPGNPFGCGNTEITVLGTDSNCFFADYSIRVVCR